MKFPNRQIFQILAELFQREARIPGSLTRHRSASNAAGEKGDLIDVSSEFKYVYEINVCREVTLFSPLLSSFLFARDRMCRILFSFFFRSAAPNCFVQSQMNLTVVAYRKNGGPRIVQLCCTLIPDNTRCRYDIFLRATLPPPRSESPAIKTKCSNRCRKQISTIHRRNYSFSLQREIERTSGRDREIEIKREEIERLRKQDRSIRAER